MRPEDRPVRVLLADDHTMFRQGIREMLATDPGIEVVAEAENGERAVALARMVEPDVWRSWTSRCRSWGPKRRWAGCSGSRPRPRSSSSPCTTTPG